MPQVYPPTMRKSTLTARPTRMYTFYVFSQYHKSGKHCVEYRRSGEKRWVNLLKTAFYIVERAQPSGGEVKEMEPDPTEGLAPVEVRTACGAR